jgi:hypothetical protein
VGFLADFFAVADHLERLWQPAAFAPEVHNVLRPVTELAQMAVVTVGAGCFTASAE